MTSPQPDYSANRKKAFKIVGISAGVLGGSALLAVVISAALPVIALVVLIAIIAAPSIFQPSEDALRAKVETSLSAVDYTTLPSYKHVADEVGTYQGSCFISCPAPTADGAVDYTNESVLQVARERLVKAGWHCEALRTTLLARERAKALFGTVYADSSCTKWNRLPVGIFFLKPGQVEIQVSSTVSDNWTAESDFDYCTSGGNVTADTIYSGETPAGVAKVCAPYIERSDYIFDNCIDGGAYDAASLPKAAAKYPYGFCSRWKPGTPDIKRYPEFAHVAPLSDEQIENGAGG